MIYKSFGLVNTKFMFSDALNRGYAVPAFNFYNMETLKSILSASKETHSPVILAISESAMQYMGEDLMMSMVKGSNIQPGSVALHLDHGSSFESCKAAIDMGFSSVMFDGSHLPFSENISISKKVSDYAHEFDVSTESELGILAGVEEDISSGENIYTNPDDVIEFVNKTQIDSLAVAIGTSHGAYKIKSDAAELRFDILEKIAEYLPNFPLVLHGASAIPDYTVKTINDFGGKISNAHGIPVEQLRRAVSMNICKINVDSDARLAFTAAVRRSLGENPSNFNPRKFLSSAMDAMRDIYMHEINTIMQSANKLPNKK